MSATGQSAPGNQPSEEELRAAYEEEIKRIRVEQVVLEQVVTLINLGMRRTGIAPGTEGERDPNQVRVAIEALRALMPVVEQVASAQAGPIRDALSQLQLAYVKIGGQAPGPAAPGATAGGAPGATPGGAAGTAQSGPGSGPGAGAGAGPSRPAPANEREAPKPGEPGPAQRSGRLWVPGQ